MSDFKEAQAAFSRLLGIMNELREKCPWDREQTIESIRHLSIEEVHELSDAILQNNPEEIKKELGDILLHIVFYSKIGEETGAFNITTVIDSLCEKLIRRHPHIYGNTAAETSDKVKENWERIKQTEKKNNKNASYLDGVPSSLPSLVKATRIQEKAAQSGFDWTNIEDVLNKVKEEWNELKEAKNQAEKEEEFGDYLFSLVNYARVLKINPDDALEKTNLKFKKRFEYIETQAKIKGLNIENMSLEEMDELWNKAKTIL
jgi:XTP/dITP diphosphohydrolase